MADTSPVDPIVRSPLVDLAVNHLSRQSDWRLWTDDFWCHLDPDRYRRPRQGWKLHISATTGSAVAVLDRVLGVVLDAGCICKFAASLDGVRKLNSADYPRGGAGKFITIYPADDDQLRALAARLHEVTAGFAGPTILSDRPYAAGSLVHYRYGAFVAEETLGSDGGYLAVVTAPDASLVEDRRDAWFAPPPWALDPFEPTRPSGGMVECVLLANRFEVRRAIAHANKGGVFEATDRLTGAEVIIKQARAGVGDGPHGWNVQDARRNEARMLELLAHSGVTPRLHALFEQEGDLFLVEELIAGTTLFEWRRRQYGVPDWRAIALRLTAAIAAVHAENVVLSDLSASNVMVRPDGTVVLIDLEFARGPGDTPMSGWTPDCAAPEQVSGAPASPAADMHALGAIFFLLCTGAKPGLAPDDSPGRSNRERLALLLEAAAETDGDIAAAAPLLLGLLDDDPTARWSLDRVRAFLTTDNPRPNTRRRRSTGGDRLLADGIDYLLGSITPDDPERLAPTSNGGRRNDPCNLYNGAAGVLGTLTRITEAGDDRGRVALRLVADWIVRRLGAQRNPLPGLYIGRSGTAVALCAAGRVLGAEDLVHAGVELFAQVPPDGPSPDITHGLAGAGCAALLLWTSTGSPIFRDRAAEYAARLAERAEYRDGALGWPVPNEFGSRYAGFVDYGFAHGTAGIGAFLLAAGTRLDRPDWVRLAAEAAETLGTVGVDTEVGALWPIGPRDRTRLLDHWCSGSAGIGAFLLRYWQCTGDQQALHWAERAADAVWARRWMAGSTMCHGLAGSGELLLDMYAATGDHHYRERAEDIAAALAARAGIHGGRLLAADETTTAYGADYAVGVAGWVDFLLRLEHGGPRPWIAEPCYGTRCEI
ncbi:class IV lanthionine synthetase LanL [Nocardia arthritidis]|uniref:Protein kinase n=1 Tax=Nocardia arthritidis TaxID=228602 RepID=A0A6G9YGT9_9NOCA|nr:class IV lanthionine synthetase LanL [Nocardia arthritidis]QIS12408.1 protein kinase [Nocardia arthritidis]